ncbi:MAG: hypothetical protein AAFV95_01215 [Bacteroidota bacterium]
MIALLFWVFCGSPLFGQPPQPVYKKDGIRKSVRKLVREMGQQNELYSEAVGYAGKKERPYKRFEALLKKATTEELLLLLSHPKAAVRGYAFWGLAKRHHPELESIFVAHARDEQMVFTHMGCTVAEIPLIEFMRWVVMPNMLDVDCKKLEKAVFQKVRDIRFPDAEH